MVPALLLLAVDVNQSGHDGSQRLLPTGKGAPLHQKQVQSSPWIAHALFPALRRFLAVAPALVVGDVNAGILPK